MPPIDDSEFERLWRSFGSQVRAAVARRSWADPAVTAEDIEQEVRLRLWRAFTSAERTPDHPASYLKQTVLSAIIDAVRRARVREAGHRQGSEDAAELAAAQREIADALDDRALLERAADRIELLSRDQQQALRLHLQGFGNREIATLCGWTEAKARNGIYRGLARLRVLLEEDETIRDDHADERAP